jgi:integrase
MGKLARIQPADPAVKAAIEVWAEATTAAGLARHADIRREKLRSVEAFFLLVGISPAEVTPQDVQAWLKEMTKRGLKPTTVYARACHLSSFFQWAMRETALGRTLRVNPVRFAMPKAPKPYQSRSTKSLTDEQVVKLLKVVRNRAAEADPVGKRDYALLLMFFATGLRRQEVLSLTGRDIEIEADTMYVRTRVKGGDYQRREVADPSVREALLDYLRTARRLSVLKRDSPVWTRHDRAGKPGLPMAAWSFVENLKKYAVEAGIGDIHLHQTRHTFARMVSEMSGSLSETQDALGHRNQTTTRVYVQRIAIKRDRHSRRILERLSPDEK